MSTDQTARILHGLRSAVVALLWEALLASPDVGGEPPSAARTRAKAARAAQALGLRLPRSGEPALTGLPVSERAELTRLTTMIEHHLTYLQLAADLRSGDAAGRRQPRQQAAADPGAYLAFLRGVAASHHEHAQAVAGLPELADCVTLADIGGGLGTFAAAWAASRADRRAILLDIPEVAEAIADLPPGVEMQPVDLQSARLTLPGADVYLLANVLHLFGDWDAVLARVIGAMRPGARIAVMETRPGDDAAAWFDLMVHMRSGLRGGLIPAVTLGAELQRHGLGCSVIAGLRAADDPFARTYDLVVSDITPGRPGPRPTRAGRGGGMSSE